MYKLSPNSIIRLVDSAYIPLDENNSDYKTYLDWLANGNVAFAEDYIDESSTKYPDSRFYDWVEKEDRSLAITTKSIEQIREIIKQKFASERYDLEIGGVELPNGMTIATDRDTQSKIAGALLFVQRNPNAVIDWKGESGWISLTKSQIENIADAVAIHVQTCFSEEKRRVSELMDINEIGQIIAKYS